LPAVGAVGESSALSSAVVTDLLKGSGAGGCTGLNFAGVAVSDSFEMAPVVDNFSPSEAAWRGIAAGQDLVLMPVDPTAAVTGIAAAADSGQLPATRLAEAATRVYALRLGAGSDPGPRPGGGRLGRARGGRGERTGPGLTARSRPQGPPDRSRAAGPGGQIRAPARKGRT